MLSESTKSVKLVYIIVLTTPTSMQTDDKIVDVSTIIILQMQYFRSKITVVPYTATLDFKRLSLNSKSESLYKPWGRRLATF